jgi:hypothetical protein
MHHDRLSGAAGSGNGFCCAPVELSITIMSKRRQKRGVKASKKQGKMKNHWTVSVYMPP